MNYANSCTEQNGVYAATKTVKIVQKPIVSVPAFTLGVAPISVDIDGTLQLAPGNYGSFYVNTRAKVHFSAGSYTFQNFYTEPDAEFTFDMSAGPISISVADDVRFGDRNTFAINGGNPSEITWNVSGDAVDFGTDGLYFGKVIAPYAYVRIPSRSHLIGGVYASKFVMEPQSTVSREPRAKEISHSEEHFGPFFESGTFRYRSVLPTTATSVEMYVYADDATIKVNGAKSTVVDIPATSNVVTVSLTHDVISGFPAAAFTSSYTFNFSKSTNYRVYWNPQTACKQGCDGSSATSAIGDFETALAIAKSTGREINMAGGIWNVTENFTDGIVPWKVGFELVGNITDLWELSSESDLPMINLGKAAHIQIDGKSPRCISGFRVVNGFNAENGGALNADNQKMSLKNVLMSNSESGKNGGAIYAVDTLNLENVRFANNHALENGGAVFSIGKVNAINVLFLGNAATMNGGAISVNASDAYIANAIFYSNGANVDGGGLYNSGATLNLWNATFFANKASTANGAIGGVANGVIGNTIFWKNTASCNTAECGDEVVSGYSAMNSSFTKAYPGVNNFVGDPKFIDESKPAGENMYMGYDAGINLAEGSHLLKTGLVNENVPNADIIGSDRDAQDIPLGPYGWTLKEGGEAFVGVLGDDGKVKVAKIAIPLIDAISGSWYQKYLASSPYARVIKASVKKHSKTRIDKASVKLWIKDAKGNIRKDVQPISFEAYRNGEENGKYVFQTMTATKGKPIVFSRRPQDAGVYEHVIVICMKELSDYFYIEAK